MLTNHDARPYAKAIFLLAQETNRLEDWSAPLSLLSTFVRHEKIAAFIASPQYGQQEKLTRITQALGDQLTPQETQLLKTLCHYRRLPLLPAIAQYYEEYKAAENNTVKATVETAYALTPDQNNALTDKLKKRFSANITLSEKILPDIIGGARIRIQDEVIDRSVIGLLHRLKQHLNHK